MQGIAPCLGKICTGIRGIANLYINILTPYQTAICMRQDSSIIIKTFSNVKSNMKCKIKSNKWRRSSHIYRIDVHL